MKRITFTLFAIVFSFLYLNAQPDSSSIDLYDLTLDQLMNLKIKVSVSSLFKESDLGVGSSVELIESEEWKRKGAQRTDDAINHMSSIVLLPTFGGANAIAIRGYANNLSVRGLATLLDEVPLNTLAWGTAQYDKPNFDLGALNRIEMIKGPGSVIYGSDAFHGVYSMKTFETDKNHISFDLSGGINKYYGGNLKLSQGVFNNKLRLSTVISSTGQQEQDSEYKYNDPNDGLEKKGIRSEKYNSQTLVLKLQSDSEKKHSFKTGFYYNKWDGKEFQGLGTHFSGGVSLGLDQDYSGADANFYMINARYVYKLPKKMSAEMNCFYWKNEHEIIYNRIKAENHTLYQGQNEHRYGTNFIFKQQKNSLNTQWIVILGYDKQGIDETYVNSISPDGDTIALSKAQFDSLSRYNTSASIQAKTSFFKNKFHIIYGGRFDNYSDFGAQLSFRFGALFQPTEKSVIKLLHGNAFRAAVGGELTGAGEIKGDPTIKPEEIGTTELVYIGTGDNYRLSAGIFRSLWINGIMADPWDDPTGEYTAKYVNKNENESFGVEFGAKFTYKSLGLDFNGSYVESVDNTNKIAYVAFPKIIANIGLTYNIKPIGMLVNVNNRIMDQVKVWPDENSKMLPTYFRTDLGISKRIKKFILYFNVRNLLNRELLLPSIWKSEFGYPEAGINLVLRVSYLLQ